VNTTTTHAVLADLAHTTGQLRRLAIRGLTRMFRPDEEVFAFRRRRRDGGCALEGVSRRYTSTVLIALAAEPPEVRHEVLDGHSLLDVVARMIRAARDADDVGEVALALWAGRAAGHPNVSAGLSRLREMVVRARACPTVELSWALSALTAPGPARTDMGLADAIARKILTAFKSETGVFAHWPAGAGGKLLRSHVACFADFVYPIQALALYARMTRNEQALGAARQAAERMCELQGPQGQWWWHFDVRTGRVIEWFPVYTVHQDAMAPMALFALEATGGDRHDEAIARGLQWLLDPPEVNEPLIDPDTGVIWRKVGRREPKKLARGIQAAASRVHPKLRAPGLDRVLPPGAIDYESRPYHMGWILYAWPQERIASLGPPASVTE